MKISRNFLRMAEVYKIFSNKDFDFSDKALEEMYRLESFGKKDIDISGIFLNKINGFAYGKKMLNITVSMWKEDIEKGLLFMMELYKDKKYPTWWLNKVFNRKTSIETP